MNLKKKLRTNFPLLFSCLKSIYHFIRHSIERSYFGPLMNSFFWRFWQPSVLTSDGFDIHSSGYPHRATLISLLGEIDHKDSLLDIGCGFGANIININKTFPHLQITGLDINPKMLAQLGLFIEDNKLQNIRLQRHNLNNLLPFADNSFDIIIADAVLMFIPNNKIDFVLSELVRVSKNAIIIHDFSCRKIRGSKYLGGRWVHNYFERLTKFSAHTALDERHTEFSGPTWSKFGKFVIVKI